jgi:predicted AlkP superfamily pyrophosphatase or phosphodiesterase
MKGIVAASDLWGMLRLTVEQHRLERALFVAYWSKVDTISHVYGPSAEFVLDEIDNFAYSFEHAFLNRLSGQALEGTLFLLTADHGHVDTPLAHTVYLRDHPELRSRLVMDPTGEPRAAYLYVRQGQMDAVCAYIEARLGDKFAVLDSQAALETGLFGGGSIAPEAQYRIGDLLVLPRRNDIFWERNEAPHTLGRHGGLTAPEMLVPLMATRLDS